MIQGRFITDFSKILTGDLKGFFTRGFTVS